ncbi:DUF4238 domain-containing protein [Microbacterium sp. p3-SID336]|nr:DUF4238 domain-containing protein [Microbacterium sp. p3-SID336]
MTDLLRNRNAYEVAPRSAAFETDFYRLDEADGLSPVYWEAWLSQVEGHAATAFEEIDAGTLSEESQEWLCLFLATQMTRGRKARRGHRALLAAQLAQVREANGEESLAEELRRGDTFAFTDADDVATIMREVDRVLENPELLPITRSNDLEALATLSSHGAGLLATRHLALYRTRRALITSDEPVVELHENMAQPALYGGVWGAPIFAFPVDPHTVLALYRRDIEPRFSGSTLDVQETLDLNAAILANSHGFAISKPGDKLAERLFLPDEPSGYGSERFTDPESGDTLFRFWAPGRWEGREDAPRRVVTRWWPAVVPPATPPTEEEQAIIAGWA